MSRWMSLGYGGKLLNMEHMLWTEEKHMEEPVGVALDSNNPKHTQGTS